MTKTVLLASVVALFAFSGCSQQTAKPEVKAEANTTAEANVSEVKAIVEEVVVEAAPATSFKEVAVKDVEEVTEAQVIESAK
ncbi:MAG: hypothetical protein K0U38_04000 [Epsilonproteobacteria bacterium]|nr:hypothetical protein [Campylobacterota bacterium]